MAIIPLLCLLTFTTLIFDISPIATSQPAQNIENNYHARVIYAGHKREEKEHILLTSEESFHVYPPRAPTGYSFRYSYFSVDSEYGKVEITDYNKVQKHTLMGSPRYVDFNDDVKPYVRITNIPPIPLLKYAYVDSDAFFIKEEIVSLLDNKIELEIYPPSSEAEFYQWFLTVMLDWYIPLKPSKIINPDGEDLLQNRTKNFSVNISSKTIRFYPQLAESSSYPFRYGLYTIYFAEGPDYPFNGVIRQDNSTFNEVIDVPAGSSVDLEIDTPAGGWDFFKGFLTLPQLSYQEDGSWHSYDMNKVAISDQIYYGEYPEITPLKLFFEGELFDVDHFFYKQLLIYDKKFKIRNDGSTDYRIKLAVESFFVKDSSCKWDENGLWVETASSMFQNAEKAFLYFDINDIYILRHIPAFFTELEEFEGHPLITIKDLYSPSGLEAMKYFQSSIDTSAFDNRYVSTSLDRAFVQIYDRSGGSDFGRYRFYIDWKPIQFWVKDHEGKAIEDVLVTVSPYGSAKTLNSTNTDRNGYGSLTVRNEGPYILSAIVDGLIVNQTYIDISDLRLDKTIILEVGSTTHEPTPSPSESSAQVEIGGIKLIPQETDKSCWAAASLMILDFYGTYTSLPSQQDLAVKLGSEEYYKNGLPQYRLLSWDWALSDPSFTKLDADPDYGIITESLTFHKVKLDIDLNRPIIILYAGDLWLGDLQISGPIVPFHSAVIVGYIDEPGEASDKVIIHDPWPRDEGIIETKEWIDVKEDLWFVCNAIRTRPRVLEGTVLTLQENQHKLYLHAYDSLGRHVGLNYETNQTEIEIPGATYLDFDDVIVIVLPLDVTDFQYVIDAKYAEEPTENYTIKITTVKEEKITFNTTKSGTINQDEKHESDFMDLSESVEDVWWQIPIAGVPMYLVLIGIVVVVILIMFVLLVKRKRKL